MPSPKKSDRSAKSTPRAESASARHGASPAPRIAETEDGTVVFSTDPLIIKDHYEIDYIHSYAEDSPFFIGLSQGKLMGSECRRCHYRFATPRGYCMQCGSATKWIELPLEGRVHTWTTCYYGSEAFLKQTPFHLILVEFRNVDTLFLARLVGPMQTQIQIGMKVRAQFLRRPKFQVTDVYFVPC
jgi:uncharacterized OB-fold protein